MRIFHAITIYQLLVCITINKNLEYKESLCILPSFIKSKFPQYFLLKVYKFFDHVLLHDTTNYQSLYENLIKEDDEIYCAGTQFPFARTLVNNEREFYYLEEAPYTFYNNIAFQEHLRSIDYDSYVTSMKLGLLDASSCYIKKIFAEYPNNCDITDKRIIRYDLLEKIGCLNKDDYINILKIFGVKENVNIQTDDTLIFFTQHFSNLKMLSYLEEIDIVTLTIDYFYNKSRLIIKQHPDDNINYNSIFYDAVFLPSLCPMELFNNIVTDEKITTMTINSHAIDCMHTADKIIFNNEYIENDYRKIHKYYAISEMCKSIQSTDMTSIVSIDGNKKIFENFGIKCNDNNDANDASIVIVDSNIQKFNISKYSGKIIMFTEAYPIIWDFLHYSKDIKLLVREIKIISKDNININKIYILVYNNSFYDKLKTIEYHKVLKYRKEEVYMKVMDEKDLRIAILEGVIEVTENKLLDVMKENEILENQIEEISGTFSKKNNLWNF